MTNVMGKKLQARSKLNYKVRGDVSQHREEQERHLERFVQSMLDQRVKASERALKSFIHKELVNQFSKGMDQSQNNIFGETKKQCMELLASSMSRVVNGILRTD